MGERDVKQAEDLNVEEEARSIDVIARVFVLTICDADDYPHLDVKILFERNLAWAYFSGNLQPPSKSYQQRQRINKAGYDRAIEIILEESLQELKQSGVVH